MIIDDIKSFSFDANRKEMFGIKSGIVWGNKDSSTFPMLYISKPKWVSQDDYEILLESIDINFIRKGVSNVR